MLFSPEANKIAEGSKTEERGKERRGRRGKEEGKAVRTEQRIASKEAGKEELNGQERSREERDAASTE